MKYFFDSYTWYLIEAQLPARVPKVQAQLEIKNSQNQKKEIPLSVTYKGRLFEVVRLEQGLAPLKVKLVVDDKTVDELVNIKRISRYQAYYWMWHRLIFMHTQLSAALRRRMGFYNEIRHSLYDAYRLISTFRYHYPEPSYHEWRTRYWRLQPSHIKALKTFSKKVANTITFNVVVDARYASNEEVEKTLDTLKQQVGFNIVPLVWQASMPLPINSKPASFVLYITAGCALRPEAVAWFVWQQMQQPQAVCIYSDHDYYTEDHTFVLPQFKPDWSLEFQRNTAYVGGVLWVEESVFSKAYTALENFVSAYALALEVGILNAQHISHIPALLWSTPHHVSNTATRAINIIDLEQHLARHRIAAAVGLDQRGFTRIRYTLPLSLPMVSIIIPTRDLFHMLQPCIDSVLKYTQWANYEIIIVDNQSTCFQTLAYLNRLQKEDTRVRVLLYDKPFNYSAINNEAVDQARGEIICLLNNDTEVISPDWLDEMVSRLLQPNIGVVGARLYFTDGRIQHAGDVVGVGGCATHLHGVIEADDYGYMHRAVIAQDLSAVTAACLVTHKALYQRLGGLNEQKLTVAFNDVDYCLRVREAGYGVMYTPYAELYHHESVSRGKEDDPVKKARAKAETDYMRQCWSPVRDGDPYYNPNLNFTKADFTLAKVPQVDWPWVN